MLRGRNDTSRSNEKIGFSFSFNAHPYSFILSLIAEPVYSTLQNFCKRPGGSPCLFCKNISCHRKGIMYAVILASRIRGFSHLKMHRYNYNLINSPYCENNDSLRLQETTAHSYCFCPKKHSQRERKNADTYLRPVLSLLKL